MTDDSGFLVGVIVGGLLSGAIVGAWVGGEKTTITHDVCARNYHALVEPDRKLCRGYFTADEMEKLLQDAKPGDQTEREGGNG